MADHIDAKSMEPYILPLRRLLGELKPRKVLEIGIGMEAYSTRIWLRDGYVHLTTIDKKDWSGMGQLMTEHNPNRFRFLEGLSQDVLPTLRPNKYDLIFIDGDHSYEGCKSDILNCMKLLAKDGVIVMDDYGVERSAIDIVDYRVIEGDFGVKQASDELFTSDEWEECYQHLDFGNGGKVYRRVQRKIR